MTSKYFLFIGAILWGAGYDSTTCTAVYGDLVRVYHGLLGPGTSVPLVPQLVGV